MNRFAKMKKERIYTLFETLSLFFPIFVERIQMILDFDLANRINQILKEWIKKN